MPTKKPLADAKHEPRTLNFSVRLSQSDARRVEAIATAHDWPLAKTLQKLIAAALDSRLVK